MPGMLNHFLLFTSQVGGNERLMNAANYFQQPMSPADKLFAMMFVGFVALSLVFIAVYVILHIWRGDKVKKRKLL